MVVGRQNVGVSPLYSVIGSGMTCRRRLHDWQRAGVWGKLHRLLLDRLGRANARAIALWSTLVAPNPGSADPGWTCCNPRRATGDLFLAPSRAPDLASRGCRAWKPHAAITLPAHGRACYRTRGRGTSLCPTIVFRVTVDGGSPSNRDSGKEALQNQTPCSTG